MKLWNPFVETNSANEIFILDQLGYKLADDQRDLTPLQRRFLILMHKKKQRQRRQSLDGAKGNQTNSSIEEQLRNKAKGRRGSSGQ